MPVKAVLARGVGGAVDLGQGAAGLGRPELFGMLLGDRGRLADQMSSAQGVCGAIAVIDRCGPRAAVESVVAASPENNHESSGSPTRSLSRLFPATAGRPARGLADGRRHPSSVRAAAAQLKTAPSCWHR